jgi:hypothetical protein
VGGERSLYAFLAEKETRWRIQVAPPRGLSADDKSGRSL